MPFHILDVILFGFPLKQNSGSTPEHCQAEHSNHMGRSECPQEDLLLSFDIVHFLCVKILKLTKAKMCKESQCEKVLQQYEFAHSRLL